MEHMRQRFMMDRDPFPVKTKPTGPPSVVSIASSSSSTTFGDEPSYPKKGAVIISSDEEDGDEDEDDVALVLEDKRPGANPIAITLKPSYFEDGGAPQKPSGFKPSSRTPSGKPINIPSNNDYVRPSLPKQDSKEDGEITPDIPDDHIFISPADAEKALRDLMAGGMNDIETVINTEDVTVKGFKEGIKLLPHQVVGRVWMRDREDLTKKRTGGILADDMGLGKTIQALTRIVEGRARKSDKEDGWAATTLVVCPLALIGQWEEEIKRMTDDVTVLKHHGPSRTPEPGVLRKNRVVVTTYDVVKSEYEAYTAAAKDQSQAKPKKKKASSDDDSADSAGAITTKARRTKSPQKSALFQVRWWRIVLDEAHNIKNRKTKGAIACCELEGKFRWCLTGTPMQNNVVELYSLMKFLRIKPFSNWNSFDSQIAKPVSSGRGANTAMKRLQVVLKQVMLRRRKDQLFNGKPILELPKREVELVPCPFDQSEKRFYDSLEGKMEGMLKKLMAANQGNSSYMSVLLLLLRLRQACNHPLLVAEDYTADMDAVDPKSGKDQDPNDEGAEELADMFGQLGVTKKCQMCMTELTKQNACLPDDTHCVDCAPLAAEAERTRDGRPSSAKIRMIMKLLHDIKDRSNGEEKTIIFSQFTKMLDLIEPFLKERGVGYVRYDGRMDAKTREASIQALKNNSKVKVILISFKAGSTGLNLTACNNVILVDLWWNPALEDQAFDRAHRFGQTRDVNIYKLKIENTVEDRILLLQDKKRELARAALSGDKIKNMRLGMEDLLALFRPGACDDDDDEDDD